MMLGVTWTGLTQLQKIALIQALTKPLGYQVSSAEITNDLHQCQVNIFMLSVLILLLLEVAKNAIIEILNCLGFGPGWPIITVVFNLRHPWELKYGGINEAIQGYSRDLGRPKL